MPEAKIKLKIVGLDEAIEKANRLLELLQEVQKTIDSLESKNVVFINAQRKMLGLKPLSYEEAQQALVELD